MNEMLGFITINVCRLFHQKCGRVWINVLEIPQTVKILESMLWIFSQRNSYYIEFNSRHQIFRTKFFGYYTTLNAIPRMPSWLVGRQGQKDFKKMDKENNT